jgi:hypothetical protein
MGLFSIWAGTVTIPNNKRPLPPPLRLTEATKDVTEIKRVRTRKPLLQYEYKGFRTYGLYQKLTVLRSQIVNDIK